MTELVEAMEPAEAGEAELGETELRGTELGEAERTDAFLASVTVELTGSVFSTLAVLLLTVLAIVLIGETLSSCVDVAISAINSLGICVVATAL